MTNPIMQCCLVVLLSLTMHLVVSSALEMRPIKPCQIRIFGRFAFSESVAKHSCSASTDIGKFVFTNHSSSSFQLYAVPTSQSGVCASAFTLLVLGVHYCYFFGLSLLLFWSIQYGRSLVRFKLSDRSFSCLIIYGMLLVPFFITDVYLLFDYLFCFTLGLCIVFLCMIYTLNKYTIYTIEHQAGYLPLDEELEESNFIKHFSSLKWYKRKFWTYNALLRKLRTMIVAPSSNERCYVNGRVHCVFRIAGTNYRLSFKLSRYRETIDDDICILASRIYSQKFSGSIMPQATGVMSAFGLTNDDTVEDALYVTFLCYQLYKERKLEHAYALFRVVNANVGVYYSRMIERVLRFVITNLVTSDFPPELFNDMSLPPREDFEPQSGTPMSAIMQVLHSVKDILSDKGFVALVTICVGAVTIFSKNRGDHLSSLSIANTEIFQAFVDTVASVTSGVEAPRSILTVVENALDMLNTLYLKYIKGEYVITYDALNKFIANSHSITNISLSNIEGSYSNIKIDGEDLQFSVGNEYMYKGQPISYNEAVSIITENYLMGKNVQRAFSGNASTRMTAMRGQFDKAFLLAETYYNKMMRDLAKTTTRVTPLCCLLYGTSGIGKSRIAEHLIDAVATVASVPNESKYVYTVQDGQKFWTGFTSAVHTIVFDDLGAGIAKSTDPTSPVATLLRVVNDIPFIPDQAAIEDKGVHHCQPLHVIVTSNYKHVNIHEHMHHKAATLRRMKYVITPCVKPEYVIGGSNSLDPEKCVLEIDDYHTFTVEECVSMPTDESMPNGEVMYNKVNFAHEGQILVHDGHCRSLSDLKLFYHAIATQHFRAMLAKRSKFQTRCIDHHSLLPCAKCQVMRLREARIFQNNPNDDEIAPANQGHIEHQSLTLVLDRGETGTIADIKTVFFLILNTVIWLWQCSVRLVKYIIGMTLQFSCWWLSVVYSQALYVEQVVVPRCVARSASLMVAQFVRSTTRDVLSVLAWLSPAHCGRKVFEHCQQHKYKYLAITAAGILACILTTIKYVKLLNMVPQTYTNVSGVPAPINMWNSGNDVQVGTASRCAKGSSLQNAINGIASRCVSLVNSDGTKQAKGIFVAANVIMTVRHFVRDLTLKGDKYELVVISNCKNVISTRTVTCTVLMKETHGVDANSLDIVYLKVDAHFYFTDISGITSDKSFFFEDYGRVSRIVIPFLDGTFTLNTSELSSLSDRFEIHSYSCEVLPKPGDSGSVVIGITDKEEPVILGLHVGLRHEYSFNGTKTMGCFAFVNRKNLASYYRNLNPVSVVTHHSLIIEPTINKYSLASGKYDVVDSEVDEKGNKQVYMANLQFVGVTHGLRQTVGKTVFEYTDEKELVMAFADKHGVKMSKRIPSKDDLVAAGYSEEQARVAGQTWPAINWWYRNISQARLLPIDKITLCCRALKDRILSNLDRRNELDGMRKYLRVLTLSEAINGVDGDSNVGGLNLKTSSGFPFFKDKVSLMDFDGELRCLSAVKQRVGITDVSPVDDYYETLAAILSGNRTGKPFVSRYKDEPIKHDKLIERGRRLFMNGPMSLTIIIRQYFLMFTTFLKVFALEFNTVYGINASSAAWSDLYHRLNRKQFWNDGDFTAFDVNISSQLLLTISQEVIIPLIKLSPNFDDVNVETLEILLMECINALVVVDNDVFLLGGMNPSGNPLTTILNCFANIIYHMFAYIEIYGLEKLPDFFEDVELYTYGDDSVYTTNLESYNSESIASVLREYNITYTNSQKKSGQHFTPKEDIVLLQRAFVEEGNRVLAPLSKSSILRALMIGDATTNYGVRWQSVIHSLWFESMHYGDQFGEELRNLLINIVERKNLTKPDYGRDTWLTKWDEASTTWKQFHLGLMVIDDA